MKKQASTNEQATPCRSDQVTKGLTHIPGKDAVGQGGTMQSWVEA